MLAALSCDPTGALGQLCRWLDDRIPGNTTVVGPVVQFLIQAGVAFVVILVVGRIARRITLNAIDRGGSDAQVRTLVDNLFTVVIITVAVLGGLTAGGLSISVLLTFGGLTSLAIGLAFQDLLRNILAGMILLVERPFRIGDLISVADQTGVVQTIELRTTSLRTARGDLAILPNLSVFNGTVVNSFAYDTRRFAVALRVPAGADLEAAIRAVRRELVATPDLAGHPEPSVVPNLEIDGGVTLQCRYWVDYRSHDPDAVAVDLVRRLFEVTGGGGTVAPAPTPPGPPPAAHGSGATPSP